LWSVGKFEQLVLDARSVHAAASNREAPLDGGGVRDAVAAAAAAAAVVDDDDGRSGSVLPIS
jgi:hypothetical protein